MGADILSIRKNTNSGRQLSKGFCDGSLVWSESSAPLNMFGKQCTNISYSNDVKSGGLRKQNFSCQAFQLFKKKVLISPNLSHLHRHINVVHDMLYDSCYFISYFLFIFNLYVVEKSINEVRVC